MKIIYDAIHKYMEFDDLLIQIIDTPEFQKLRNIKQLGLCYLVFPGANHNRFEHSLGVSYLCGSMIENLKKNQPELNITTRQILLVRIAGLVHDIGHACFSHFFDNHFLKNKIIGDNIEHEHRSCSLFSHIIKKYNINLTEEEIKIVQEMIVPKDNNSFLYQIVANKDNGLDCDKFDYIARDTYHIGLSYSFDYSRLIQQAKVINNKICFPAKCYYDILDLFHLRYKLHKQVYTHPCVRGIEMMVLEVLNLSYDKLEILEKVEDISKFHLLTDNILDLVYHMNITEAIKILDRIKTRNLYKLIKEYHYCGINIETIKEKFKNSNFIIDNISLNYSTEDNNPMDNVLLYKNNKLVKTNNLSGLLPSNFEENIIRFYKK